MPESWFDQCPAVIYLESQGPKKAKPFKFLDMWTTHEIFLDMVNKAWQTKIPGIKIYKVVSKMRLLKKDLKKLNREAFADIDIQYAKLNNQLVKVQEQIHKQPENVQNRRQEEEILRELDIVRKQ